MMPFQKVIPLLQKEVPPIPGNSPKFLTFPTEIEKAMQRNAQPSLTPLINLCLKILHVFFCAVGLFS